MGIVDELRGRGFEIGVHGVFHDRSMFSSRGTFEAPAPALREAASGFGAVGFRSPATHRSSSGSASCRSSYDCTIPQSDPYEPQPGGCCSVWPFFIGDVVELPYTLPQDHTLFTVLGHRRIDVWLAQVESLTRLNGLSQFSRIRIPGTLATPTSGHSMSSYWKRSRLGTICGTRSPRDRRVVAERDTGTEGHWSLVRGRASLRDDLVAFEPDASAPIAS